MKSCHVEAWNRTKIFILLNVRIPQPNLDHSNFDFDILTIRIFFIVFICLTIFGFKHDRISESLLPWWVVKYFTDFPFEIFCNLILRKKKHSKVRYSVAFFYETLE